MSVSAQNSPQNFKRTANYDVRHYILRVSFDRATRTVFGDTTVQLKPSGKNFNRFELDAANLNFESVKLEPDNKNLQFRVSGNKVFVTLDKAYSSEDLISVRFKYSAKPKKGVYFVEESVSNGKVTSSAQIWTQGEPDEAHHWFPSFDFPSDKATTEQFITVRKGETAIGNGELLEEKENPDGTVTFHYKMPVPHSTYLVSFIVGEYVKVSDSYKNIPLGYYIYPGRENLVKTAYGNTKEMMRVFEQLTGIDYPFNKYDQTIVSNFQFGGMENITATTMADTEIFFSNISPRLVGDLVAHELAHSWFGNLVTCDNWAELWLNEGFATFMEAAFRERLYGREDYLEKIRGDAEEFTADDAVNRRRHALFNRYGNEYDKLFDRPATVYNKGSAVIHTLRETVGDEAFWKAVNIYLVRHKFANVETPDLQKAMEEASGKNLEWFFRQWVYGAGHPKLDVSQTYDAKTKTLKIAVNQTQKIDGITPPAFILPLEVEIKTAQGTKTQKLEIKKRQEVFSIKVDSKPTGLVLDRNSQIPLKTFRIYPLK